MSGQEPDGDGNRKVVAILCRRALHVCR